VYASDAVSSPDFLPDAYPFLGMNCEKNAVVCEGYHEKQIWKSGKEKAEEGED
jgi:hypothetical protein